MATVLAFGSRLGPELELGVRRRGLLQRFEAGLHDEEKEGRAERASLLDAHRARHCHGLAIEVELELELILSQMAQKPMLRG